MKRIIISVSNDVVTDQRVNKVAGTLLESGVEIVIVGRMLRDSLPGDGLSYNLKRFNLLFNKGALFYAALNFRLFFYLLFKKFDFLLSNDLDTLLPNYLISKIKRKPLVYDTHEYFTGVPEIQNRKWVKKTWESIEKFVFPKLKTIYTVNQSIADLYIEKYGKNVNVIRNFSKRYKVNTVSSKSEIGLPEDKRIVIIQGTGINMDRGGEEAVKAMQFLSDTVLLIIGGGQAISLLKKMVDDLNLHEKVIFKPKMPYKDLMQYTSAADLGLSLDKDTNINYRFSLPNKLFDYIQAEIPVLATDLVEIKKIIKQYDIGEIIQSAEPELIAQVITKCFADEKRITSWKSNLVKASEDLCWENEAVKLKEIYTKLGFIFE